MSDTKDIEAMLDDYVYALAIIDSHRATERSRASFHIEQRELWQRVVDRKQRLLAAFADLEGENRCDCCAGTGTPIRGKPCMCGGTGKMSRAAVYLREQLIERDARIAELEAGARVPGMMRCAKCEFVLTRTNLYVNQGTTGPGSSETEPCPNGCGPLWPMTWRDYASGMDKTVMRYLDERDEARAALEAENAALRADAERYEYLRNPHNETYFLYQKDGFGGVELMSGPSLDDAIDAARKP